MKFQSKHKYFHSRKCIWKYRLRNGSHFVQRETSLSYKISMSFMLHMAGACLRTCCFWRNYTVLITAYFRSVCIHYMCISLVSIQKPHLNHPVRHKYQCIDALSWPLLPLCVHVDIQCVFGAMCVLGFNNWFVTIWHRNKCSQYLNNSLYNHDYVQPPWKYIHKITTKMYWYCSNLIQYWNMCTFS